MAPKGKKAKAKPKPEPKPKPAPKKEGGSQVITRTALRRLMKEEADADIVSSEAVEVLQEHLQNRAIDITKKALELTLNSKRKTVTKADIKMAIK
ncbi:MAG: histone [Candidatus Helarchaeales archaeon]